MKGYFGRALMTWTTHQTCQQPDGGNLLSSTSNKFSRNFSTDARSTQGNRTEQSKMDNMHHNRFIMGLKNIINGLISPVNNFDLCSRDLHRLKFTNNSMAGISNDIIPNSGRPQSEELLKTAILGLGVDTCSSSNRSHSSNSNSDGMECKVEAAIVAIDASEDFPEINTLENLSWQPKSDEKCTCFENNLATTSTDINCIKEDPGCESSDDSFVIFPDNDSSKCLLSKAKSLFLEKCNRRRQRQISECSDDSFVICFTDDAPEGVLEVISDEDCDTDCEFESDNDTISDDSEDEDEVIVPNENKTDNLDATDGIPFCIQKTEKCFLNSEEANQPDSGFDEQKMLKRVRFNLKPEVHMMHVWNFAYRASRKGHWDMYARDRERFQRRVKCLGEILCPVLDSNHRERIYKTRFCDNTSTGIDKSKPLKETNSKS